MLIRAPIPTDQIPLFGPRSNLRTTARLVIGHIPIQKHHVSVLRMTDGPLRKCFFNPWAAQELRLRPGQSAQLPAYPI